MCSNSEESKAARQQREVGNCYRTEWGGAHLWCLNSPKCLPWAKVRRSQALKVPSSAPDASMCPSMLLHVITFTSVSCACGFSSISRGHLGDGAHGKQVAAETCGLEDKLCVCICCTCARYK